MIRLEQQKIINRGSIEGQLARGFLQHRYYRLEQHNVEESCLVHHADLHAEDVLLKATKKRDLIRSMEVYRLTSRAFI